MIIVNGFQPLTNITKCSILDVEAVLDPPLKLIVIAYEKCLLLEINTITRFLLFRMKYVIDRGCLFDY